MKKTVDELKAIVNDAAVKQESYKDGLIILKAADVQNILSELYRLQSENDELLKRLNDK